jgi:hypothetical protein
MEHVLAMSSSNCFIRGYDALKYPKVIVIPTIDNVVKATICFNLRQSFVNKEKNGNK